MAIFLFSISLENSINIYFTGLFFSYLTNSFLLKNQHDHILRRQKKNRNEKGITKILKNHLYTLDSDTGS